MRRNINQASQAIESKDYQQAINLLKDVIEVPLWVIMSGTKYMLISGRNLGLKNLSHMHLVS